MSKTSHLAGGVSLLALVLHFNAGAALNLDRHVIAARNPTQVPRPLSQGKFMSPQSVSALAISPGGPQIAVADMNTADTNNEHRKGETS